LKVKIYHQGRRTSADNKYLTSHLNTKIKLSNFESNMIVYKYLM